MTTPPRILTWLLEKVCPPGHPDLYGDLLEQYETHVASSGRSFANRKLLLDMVSVVPLNFLIKEKRIKPKAMFITNLKIAKRMLVKNAMYTIINICGLSVSIAACILITLFIKDEISFDKHFDAGDKVYRIAGDYSQGGADRVRSAQTSYLVKPMIENDLVGLESITRADFTGDIITVNGDKQYNENAIVFADSTFFDVFKMHFQKGDVSTALDQPENVVLDSPTALKFFGTDDVLGKTITLREKDFVVTGIVDPLPANSHFRFNIVFPVSGIKQWYPDWVLTNASGTSLYTYIRVKDNFNPGVFETTANKQVKARWGWEGDSAPKYFLQPLRTIHLESDLQAEIGVNGSLTTVYIFAITAIVIFLLACINYVNLTTASSFHRGKEVGMKKVLGSTVRMQISQFQTESFAVAIIALVLAIVMAALAMPMFNEVSGKNLVFNPIEDYIIGLGIMGVLVIIGALAGALPAFVLLRTSTINMLYNKLELSGQKSVLRNGLIVFQFAIAVTLITCTLVVIHQISFVRKTDLGIDPESVVLIPLPTSEIAAKHELLRTEFLRNSSVLAVSASANKATENVGGWRPYRPDPSKQEDVSCPSTAVSHEFFETLKASMAEGRTFSRNHPSDKTTAYILNESAVKFFGFDKPVGRNLTGAAFNGSEWFERKGEIIGVVKDFHFASLHHKVQPVVFYLGSEQTESYYWLEVRILSKDMHNTISSLKSLWEKIVVDRPFEFEFMDEAIANHYQAEQRFLKIFTAFSGLSVVIGGLGLLGLTAFMAKRRTKEIGIRRVMGATTSTLIRILCADFLKLVLVANLVGWPVAYYFMNRWMENYAYHTSIPVWAFLITGAGVMIIAFLCIVFHSLKVTRINPVKSLKVE